MAGFRWSPLPSVCTCWSDQAKNVSVGSSAVKEFAKPAIMNNVIVAKRSSRHVCFRRIASAQSTSVTMPIDCMLRSSRTLELVRCLQRVPTREPTAIGWGKRTETLLSWREFNDQAGPSFVTVQNSSSNRVVGESAPWSGMKPQHGLHPGRIPRPHSFPSRFDSPRDDPARNRFHSTVTLLARLRGLSTSQPRSTAMW